jgi:hypothetical protein
MGTWRNNSTMSYSTENGSTSNWGSIKLEGDDDLTVGGSYVRNLGMGIEGRPNIGSSSARSNTISRRSKLSSGLLRSNGKATTSNPMTSEQEASSSTAFNSSDIQLEQNTKELDERLDRRVRTTLALLQTFHANTCFQLSQLQTYLSRRVNTESGDAEQAIQMTPKDILSFELGPFSGLDVRYLGWLVAEYGAGTTVVLKRGWKDLFGFIIFGYS